ncbi:MAG TPA: SAM-dependent methyltransferase [Micromonosporaceae bacterium]
MTTGVPGSDQKPATAARMYDYFLGGIHNFAADREAARKVVAQFPDIPVGARANRAFLRRAVRFLAGVGIRQFLDIGSGIPTQGNVHEIAQEAAGDARVVYVDIDPVAVAESLDILAGNEQATAIRADMRDPGAVLTHPRLVKLLDLSEPTALLMGAVLHFVPDDAQAHSIRAEFLNSLASGSYLLVTHAASESFENRDDAMSTAVEVYKRQTTTPGKVRSRAEMLAFFDGLELVEPGVVWVPQWRPDPQERDPLLREPHRSCVWGGVARKP